MLTTRLPKLAAICAFAAIAFTGCSAAGSGGAATPSPTAAASAESTTAEGGGTCADVQAEIDSIRTSVESISTQVPGDIPGAVATLSTIGTSLTTLQESVTDPDLKTHVDTLVTEVTELQVTAGELANGEGGFAAAASILTQLGEVESALSSLTAYCELQTS
jgi:hypothetical protein